MKKYITTCILFSFIGLNSIFAQFTDNFSGTLSAWTDKYGNDWQIQNNELHGFYSLSMGSIYDHQADLILNDQYQISGSWKASIDFIRTVDDEFSSRYDAWGSFSLWLNSNQKFSIYVGGGGENWGGQQDSISFMVQEWNGTWGTTNAPVSIEKVRFNWNPDLWHTASVEKRGNIYSVFVDNACIGHYIDNFLNGQGKIGLHTYGTKRFDNFTLNPLSCTQEFADYFSGSLSAWTDMYGNDWQIQNNELHGFYSLSMGSIYDHQADLILNDQYQISGNWKASIDFIRTVDDEFSSRYDAWGSFSLWLNSNQKFSIYVGGGGENWGGQQDSISFMVQEWNGTWGTTNAPVSIEKVRFNWNPDLWHTASVEKRGNIYSVFVDNACIGHYIDNFLNGQGKIGLHTYGTKQYDNFALETCSNLTTGIQNDQISETLNAIRIYPNPVFDKITVESADVNNEKSVQLISIYGDIMTDHLIFTDQIEIDISMFSKGFYMLKVEGPKGIFLQKIVKE